MSAPSARRDDLLPELLRSLRLGIVLLDSGGRVVIHNPAALELLSVPSERMTTGTFFDGPPLARELSELEGSFWSAMADEEYPLDTDRELALKTASGTRELRVRLSRLRLDGRSFGLLVVDDNERVKRTERALAAALGEAQDQALRDPLTGLFNRRHIESVLPAELNRARRLSSPLSLLVIDLDHFKAVNDSFGHPTGDRVLVEFARLLNRILRVGDTSARVGGEEFCVVLPHSDAGAGNRAADRLHRVIRALRFQEEPALRVTASIGVAALQPAAVSGDLAGEAQQLLARADAALYRAKQAGRNCTIVAEE